MTSAAAKRSRHLRPLRALALGVVLALAASQALAQDFLRGALTPSYSRWQGVYLGVTGSQSLLNANFTTGTSDLVAFILRDTTMENVGQVSTWNTAAPGSAHINGFGGFLGYNLQIAPDLVLGFEGTYTKMRDNQISSADSEHRSFDENNGYRADVTVNTSMTVSMNDYATARARAGYVLGQFLPYGFIGAALARGTLDRFASVFATETPTAGGTTLALNPNPTISTDHRNFTTFGGVFGVGTEVTILPNLFLRAEYEYAAFAAVAGTRMRMQTGRIGVGFKF